MTRVVRDGARQQKKKRGPSAPRPALPWISGRRGQAVDEVLKAEEDLERNCQEDSKTLLVEGHCN
jgi:hypothetical protein